MERIERMMNPFNPFHPWLLLSITPEIHITVMPSQEIHEPFVIRLRNPKQRQHLLVTSVCPLETLPHQMLHLAASDRSLRVRLRDRVPEISDDDFVLREVSQSILRHREVA